MKRLIPEQMRLRNRWLLPFACLAFCFLFLFATIQGHAQTVVWEDYLDAAHFFRIDPLVPSDGEIEHCERWQAFLNDLGEKSFAGVTLTGDRYPEGISISDPVAATALANLLHSRTPGTVTSDGNVWTVTACGSSACGFAAVALSVNGNESACDCSNERFAVRPYFEKFGGLNTSTCGEQAQSMRMEFHSGVSVDVAGPTEICNDQEVLLTANVVLGCEGPYEYEWSNGATGQSIQVSQPGSYAVTAISADGNCQATSSPVEITGKNVTVEATSSAAVVCSGPVQLTATGSSDAATSTYCFPTNTQNKCVLDCSDNGVRIRNQASWSVDIDAPQPAEITLHLYYLTSGASSFAFQLNGEEIDTYTESEPNLNCQTAKSYPRTIVLPAEKFDGRWQDGPNTLTVAVQPQNIFYIKGIEAELPGSAYQWLPAEGLDDPNAANPIAHPTATTTYTVTYEDASGCSATAEVEVIVRCFEIAGKSLEMELVEGCALDVPAHDLVDVTDGSADDLVFTADPPAPYAPGITRITVKASDGNGGTAFAETTLLVHDNLAPVFPELADIVVPVDVNSCAAALESLPVPDVTDNCTLEEITHDQEDLVFAQGETIVTWTATDIYGNTTTATQTVIVTNTAPVITSLEPSATTARVGEAVSFDIDFTDENIESATIDWGDGTTPQIVTAPASPLSVSHAFAAAGTYTVGVTLRDLCGLNTGASATVTVETLGQKGSVSGDGWFESKRGYYVAKPRESGKAQFHYHARHGRNSETLSGSVRFKFKKGKLEFKSQSLESLVIDDETAVLTAMGKVNGKRGYQILIAMVDEDHPRGGGKHGSVSHRFGHPHKPKHPRKGGGHHKDRDKIRVQISDSRGRVIYDTQPGYGPMEIAAKEIGGGSIRINIEEQHFHDHRNPIQEFVEAFLGNEGTSVYPNPFTDFLHLNYQAASPREKVVVQLVDLGGKVIVSESFAVSDDGHYFLDIPDHARRGVYLLVVSQGRRVEYLRLVRK